MLKIFGLNYFFGPKPEEVTINSLPDEILVHIFHFLPVTEILPLALVCQRWNKLSTDAGVWRNTVVVCSSKLGKVCPKAIGIIKTHGEIVSHLRMKYILRYPFLRSLITPCKNIVSLELIMCRIHVDFVEDLKIWPNLERLSLKNSLLVGGPLVLSMGHFTRLSYICLSDFGLTTENCECLLHFQDLNHILIEKIIGLELGFIKELIKKKQNTLKTFHMYGGASVDDECLFMLSECPSLKDLAINRCDGLSDHALDAVAVIPNISHLKLWHSFAFSEKQLKKTLQNPNLWKLQLLNLSQIDNMTPPIVDLVAEHYKNLKFFSVYGCQQLRNPLYKNQVKLMFKHVPVVLT